MKRKISITIDEKNLYKIRESMTHNRHKNKSQAIEFFVKKLINEIKNESKA